MLPHPPRLRAERRPISQKSRGKSSSKRASSTAQARNNKDTVASVQNARFAVHEPRSASDCAKFDVTVEYTDYRENQRKKTIAFGRRSAVAQRSHLNNDFPHHKDRDRQQEYLRRHSPPKENWSLSGANTRGFYARHMLWSEPTVPGILKHLRHVLGLRILEFPADVVRQLREPYEQCGSMPRAFAKEPERQHKKREILPLGQ